MLVCLVTFVVSLTRMVFVNDHFDRIARGRQIAAYDEHPFADFRDPGHFLTLYVSAGAQALTGGSLLGDAVVVNLAFAGAATLTFWLAEAASGSLGIGLVAVLIGWLVPPRYYDYDKVFLYLAGLALCWRYVDRPAIGTAAAAAVLAGIATLFRYDNGVFVIATVGAGMLARQWRHPRVLIGHALVCGLAWLLTLAPAVAFVQATAGLTEAARQITEYAGGETSQLGLPRLGVDRVSLIYLGMAATVPLALVRLLLVFGRGWSTPLLHPAPKILAAIALLVGFYALLLRDPIGARLGAVIPPSLVLAAWAAGRTRREASSATRRPHARTALAVAAAAIVCLIGAVTVVEGARLRRATGAVARRVAAVGSDLRHPRAGSLFTPAPPETIALIDYLKACTTPDTRLLLTWFAPEVLYFSERGAAGGMVVFSSAHWSSDQDQRRTVAQMRQQHVVAVLRGTVENLARNFAEIAEELSAGYQVVGDLPAPNHGEPFQILIRRELSEAPRAAPWDLPCPAR